jgi:hypothetical protein
MRQRKNSTNFRKLTEQGKTEVAHHAMHEVSINLSHEPQLALAAFTWIAHLGYVL